MAEHTHTHEQPHTHAHDHEHGPGHTHSHNEGDTYFIDQMCMVGLSGAFGAVCLSLWFWQTEMLKNLLAASFHPWVLATGVALVTIALVRGWVLWQQSRDPHFAHDHHHHDHEHNHAPTHEHQHAIQGSAPLIGIQKAPTHVHGATCAHDHKPGDACDHDHAHELHAQLPPHEHHVGQAHAHHDHDAADHDHGWAPWRYVVILVPLILFLLGLPNRIPQIDDQGHERLIGDFTSIIYEAMPFIVLGVLLAGLLEEFVPQQAIAKVVPRNFLLAISIGALLGLVFPMCECGIIVVMKRLLRKGLPLSVCVAYMLAGPVINVVVMASTFVAFGSYDKAGVNDVLGGPWYVVGLRVGLSYLVALGTACVVEWQWRKHGKRLLHPSILRGLQTAGDDADNGPRPWSMRINNITQTALHDFVDIMAFLVLGAVLAAGGKFIIKESNVQQYLQETPAIAILLMMGIAILFCLCSEADAFVAANFPLFWPDSSKLAFLVLGPMLDFKLLLMYTRVFRARLIYTIVIALIVQVFAYSMVAGEIFGKVHPTPEPMVIRSQNVDIAMHCFGIGDDPLAQIAFFGAVYAPSEKGEPLGYKTLYESANLEDIRSRYKGKIVSVKGQYYNKFGNPHAFDLARMKITCCQSDIVALQISVVARDTISGFQPNEWIEISGTIQYVEQNNAFRPILVVSSASDITRIAPDPDPYVQ